MAQASSISATDRPLRSVLIVDDHPLFCDALSMTLAGPVGISRVEAVGNLGAALDRLAMGEAPDVIVLDLNLPDVNGLDGVVRMRQAAPATPIIVVSSMDEPRVVRSALRAGVSAFVPKHAAREAFREAFAILARGETHPSRRILDQTTPTPAEEAVARLSLLTRQQGKILQLVSAGLMNKQIAYELSVAETTVKAHITAIMRKLGVQTRTQAVLFTQDVSFAAMSPAEMPSAAMRGE
ncbi:response regulator [Gemmobacter serpentinus]|uniref:response regulator n=1 Tax=Gemmobacter serpentinus TaxID=2652247 RepID=UPI00124EE0CF|nr:response regulator transcription factor [Gemmobacter serpentinus]